MNGLFPNQDFGRTILKHRELPICATHIQVMRLKELRK